MKGIYLLPLFLSSEKPHMPWFEEGYQRGKVVDSHFTGLVYGRAAHKKALLILGGLLCVQGVAFKGSGPA
ncbi:MAG: hypothetical protein JRI86_04120 [Deltaproteobacteria bacterium]|nr:hypothetical protein [Deltaproteobacteria bacterium]